MAGTFKRELEPEVPRETLGVLGKYIVGATKLFYYPSNTFLILAALFTSILGSVTLSLDSYIF